MIVLKQWNLIRFRKENNLTQIEMAKLLGISSRAYYLKENGKAPFYSKEMFAISDLFDKPLEEIFLR